MFFFFFFLLFFWPEGIVWLYTQIYTLTIFLDFDVLKKQKKVVKSGLQEKKKRDKKQNCWNFLKSFHQSLDPGLIWNSFVSDHVRTKHIFWSGSNYTSTNNALSAAEIHNVLLGLYLNEKTSHLTVAVSSCCFLKQQIKIKTSTTNLTWSFIEHLWKPCYSEVTYCPLLFICILQHRLRLLINQGGGTYQYNRLHYKNTFNELLISNICKCSISSTFWG